jgi:hypothetical protein
MGWVLHTHALKPAYDHLPVAILVVEVTDFDLCLVDPERKTPTG